MQHKWVLECAFAFNEATDTQQCLELQRVFEGFTAQLISILKRPILLRLMFVHHNTTSAVSLLSMV